MISPSTFIRSPRLRLGEFVLSHRQHRPGTDFLPWRESRGLHKIESCRDPPEGTKMRRRGGNEQPVKGRRAKARTSATPSVADLQKQVDVLIRELKEAREQQTAT